MQVVLDRGKRGVQSRPNPRGSSTVEGVEVDVADALEELGGPGVGQGLGQLVALGLVFGLQLAELGHGRGPARRTFRQRLLDRSVDRGFPLA